MTRLVFPFFFSDEQRSRPHCAGYGYALRGTRFCIRFNLHGTTALPTTRPKILTLFQLAWDRLALPRLVWDAGESSNKQPALS